MTSGTGSPIPSLVSPAWLAARLAEPDLAILDASWYLPDSGRDADLEYRAMHVPGAVRFNLDLASARDSDLPHMLPTAEDFAEFVERLGIRREDRVICYDGSGVNLSAARVWWMFRIFGHPSVAVLDGGFPAWASETRPVQRGTVQRPRSGYRAEGLNPALLADRSVVDRIVADGSAQIVDCRVPERFRGEVAEPRPGLRRGHVEGSRNLPYPSFTDPATGRYFTPSVLRDLIVGAGIDPARPIVALCGSGTSACTLALAIEVLRESNLGPIGPPVAIYDGSWSEYGRTAAGK